MESMNTEPERHISTGELIRRALDEAKMLAKAEVLHAKQELKDDLQAAKRAGIFLGAAFVLALSGLSVLLVALALALPLPHGRAALIVGAVLVVLAGVGGFLGVQRLPKAPLAKTKRRIQTDIAVTRERLA